MKKIFTQLIKFSFVGIIAAIVDWGLLIILKELFFADVVIASAVSFIVSVIVNYILSMRFVFESKNDNKIKEFIIFALLSTGGLLINQFIMWYGVEVLSIYYLFVKFFAAFFVLVYNFITRKVFLEKTN